MHSTFTIGFDQIDLKNIGLVGGKNASLGEMIQNLSHTGIRVPKGFAITSTAYWQYLEANSITSELSLILNDLDTSNFENLNEISCLAKTLLKSGEIPGDVQKAINEAYAELGETLAVAVRSSATAEDLPNASFAGQQESYLNISGYSALLETCKKCYASLFTSRAIKYRADKGFDHMEVALSVGVQQMVRSDKGCSGVAFTLDPETGFRNVVVINGVWGLGENMVQGTVDPDEFVAFKPFLGENRRSVISRKLGSKHQTMVYGEGLNHHSQSRIVNVQTPKEKRKQFVLTDEEVEHLATWALIIEDHYQCPMDIEWAKDGVSGQLYIVQARPETVHSINANPHIVYQYRLASEGRIIVQGMSLGSKIAAGKARILDDPSDAHKLQEGDVLVTDLTNPDWVPIMKKAGAIVTNKGGRTSHAAIVAREMGVVAVVGTGNASELIKDGQKITVSCAQGKTGKIYDGLLEWEEKEIDTRKIHLPNTEVMLILSDPERAFQSSFLPNNGVGLMRLEFVVSNTIKAHPMALVKYNQLEDLEERKKIDRLTNRYKKREDYFIDQLSQAVATVAAAFYPKDVIVRMSDFKSNEYANLIGGRQFEFDEENPMIGFRGASRYYSPLYRDGFQLECAAMKMVREEMGFTNVKLMIPFCRTVEEGRKVTKLMADFGLVRGVNGLEIYTMVEVPSNVILADQFAEVFDGFSIGSNDLTQLALGLDRDSELVSSLFDENNEAVCRLIDQVIEVAKETGTKIGLCGQAPSDFPEFAGFLVNAGIDSISFTPDALIAGIKNICESEQSKEMLTQRAETNLGSDN